MARASRVVVGQHQAAADDRGRAAPRTPIGADEARAAAAAATEALADTVPLDETTLREIFGSGEEPEPK